ncbi:MAG TPA: hypothetical protein VEV44_17020 [Pseudoneobacillus sp.]|nr:hypothetical protein [Pseudoneobacillus sp.]
MKNDLFIELNPTVNQNGLKNFQELFNVQPIQFIESYQLSMINSRSE